MRNELGIPDLAVQQARFKNNLEPWPWAHPLQANLGLEPLCHAQPPGSRGCIFDVAFSLSPSSSAELSNARGTLTNPATESARSRPSAPVTDNRGGLAVVGQRLRGKDDKLFVHRCNCLCLTETLSRG